MLKIGRVQLDSLLKMTEPNNLQLPQILRPKAKYNGSCALALRKKRTVIEPCYLEQEHLSTLKVDIKRILCIEMIPS